MLCWRERKYCSLTHSHTHSRHPTQANTPALTPANELDLPTPEGWKAELTYVAGYIPRWFTRPQTVIYPSINRARRRVTTLIESNALPLSHANTALYSHDFHVFSYLQHKFHINLVRCFLSFNILQIFAVPLLCSMLSVF